MSSTSCSYTFENMTLWQCNVIKTSSLLIVHCWENLFDKVFHYFYWPQFHSFKNWLMLCFLAPCTQMQAIIFDPINYHWLILKKEKKKEHVSSIYSRTILLNIVYQRMHFVFVTFYMQESWFKEGIRNLWAADLKLLLTCSSFIDPNHGGQVTLQPWMSESFLWSCWQAWTLFFI